MLIIVILFSRREVHVLARPAKCRCICSYPKYDEFAPKTSVENGTIEIALDEYEVFRLLNFEGKTHTECAERMNISRPTVSRINKAVCKKLSDALVNGRRITIGGGDVIVCQAPKPECSREKHCCHKIESK